MAEGCAVGVRQQVRLSITPEQGSFFSHSADLEARMDVSAIPQG